MTSPQIAALSSTEAQSVEPPPGLQLATIAKTVSFDANVQVFPTTAAVRAKAVRQQREEVLKAAGDTDAVKSSRKRKPQQQEDHRDDCGSDIEPLS